MNDEFHYYLLCGSRDRRLVALNKTLRYIIAFAATLVAFNAAYADSSLTFTLDPSASERAAHSESDIQLHHQSLHSTSKAKYAKYASSSRKETVIGWVGVVVSAKVEIKRSASRASRSLFSCPRETYLAIVNQRGRWYGILMVDGSTGWIEKSMVNVLNYQVVSPTSPATESGSRIVNTALKYLGIPYRWGGCSPVGLDCSGFVKTVFATNGVSLPRVARDQAQVGEPVSFSGLRAGDRLYFACKGGQVDHTGIYMGNGLFIHSSVGRHGVAVDSISKPLFARSLVVARRS